MKHYTIWLLGCCLIGTSMMTYAETRYVTDELQLSLYERFDSKGELLMRLNSGTELELLEEKSFFAKVRTKDGTEGWTKAGFLTKDKPAKAQLEDLKVENKSLSDALEEKKQQLSKIKAELSRAQEHNQPTNSVVTIEKQDDPVDTKETLITALDRVQHGNNNLKPPICYKQFH
ncbi:MAG: TIGR04211 family SH3 domain-containing protein [Candidatus Thiodiazotropha sp.]